MERFSFNPYGNPDLPEFFPLSLRERGAGWPMYDFSVQFALLCDALA
jgi:hypothetical protein